MTDHYTTLGVDQNAPHEEIKKAYRKLANQHHPDKGGDQEVFKNISTAYDVLGNEQKRAEYDHQQRYGNQDFHFQHHNFNDIFSQAFGFGEMFGQQQRRKNRDLNLRHQVSLVDSYLGKQYNVSFTLPSGKKQDVVIDIPAGIMSGMTINYSGLGDDSITNLPRGDLHVTIIVTPDPIFERRHDDILYVLDINPIEAMIGCKKEVKSINGESVYVDVRPGVETGVEYAKRGHGFTNIQTGHKGSFVAIVKIKTPIVRDVDLINKLTHINNILNGK